jgi:sugar phosphate isomerase/epimerase
MVIGSGASRATPDPAVGDAPFVEIGGEIAEAARPLDIVIAPESLNRTETNVGNDLRSLAFALRDREVGYTADSYHILYEWDAEGRPSAIEDLYEEQIPFAPSHVHIANLPRTGVDSDDPMLLGFASRLRDLGYSGNVSLECNRADSSGLRGFLGHLRTLFQP